MPGKGEQSGAAEIAEAETEATRTHERMEEAAESFVATGKMVEGHGSEAEMRAAAAISQVISEVESREPEEWPGELDDYGDMDAEKAGRRRRRKLEER